MLLIKQGIPLLRGRPVHLKIRQFCVWYPPTTQVYRSTGDFDAASSLYEKYSAVSEDGGWLELREVVMARKLPRRMLIQPLTQLQGGQL